MNNESENKQQSLDDLANHNEELKNTDLQQQQIPQPVECFYGQGR